MKSLASKICFSLDHEDFNDALRDVETLQAAGLVWVKVNPIHLTTHGFEIVSQLQNMGLKVFVDAKFFNTAHVLSKTALSASAFRPEILNCVASAGKDAMTAFAECCNNQGVMPSAVTILTSISSQECSELYGRDTSTQVLYFAQQAVSCGITSIVCSGHELDTIRSDSTTKNLFTIVPGIRNLGDENQDQHRIMTPMQAHKRGADLIVMGYSLYHGDVLENWKKSISRSE